MLVTSHLSHGTSSNLLVPCEAWAVMGLMPEGTLPSQKAQCALAALGSSRRRLATPEKGHRSQDF